MDRRRLRSGRVDREPAGLVEKPNAPVKFYKNCAAGREALEGQQDLGSESIAMVAADARDSAGCGIDQVDLGSASGKRRPEAAETTEIVMAKEMERGFFGAQRLEGKSDVQTQRVGFARESGDRSV